MSTSSEDSEASLAGGIKHGSVWLEDGNIVLLAKDTYFRAHRSVLSRNSDVFRDMFDSTDPDANAILLDDCPVVEVSDSPIDVGYFLSSLYDGHGFYSHDVSLPFDAVAALIHLGSKYQAESPRSEGIRRLSLLESAILGNKLVEGYDSLVLWKPSNAMRLAEMAESLRLDDVLPIALYACCQLKDELVDGAVGTDGDLERLSPLNMKRCLTGRHELAIAHSQISGSIISSLKLATCPRAVDRVCSLKVVEFSLSPPSSLWHPLEYIDWFYVKLTEAGICPKPCAAAAKEWRDSERTKLVRSLPGVFGLS